MNVTDALVEALKQEDVEYLLGFPSHPLLDTGKAAAAGIRTIVVRQERTGLHMADAIGRLSAGENIAAFCMQHGPGTENSVGGVAQAYAESAPLVAIPAGYARSKTDVDPKFNSLLNYQHVSKSCEQLTDPTAVDETMRRAFSEVKNGRPRPAVVEVPLDVFDRDVPEFQYREAVSGRSAPDPADVQDVVDAVLEAEKPMIYAGQGVHYARAWDPLRELAELFEVPVATSLNGKSAFPEDHPLALGAGSKSEPGPLHHYLRETDLIFGIGCSFTTTNYGISVPPEVTVVHATLDPMDINKDVQADYAMIGDARLTLEAVLEEADERLDGERGRHDNVVAEIDAVYEEWIDEWRPKLSSDEQPLNPYRVIHDLESVVDPAETIITHDAGNARDMLSAFWTATEPLSYIGWGKTTQLGYGLGLAMGSKLLHPEKLCINLWGDGAIGMTMMDFETAVREEIPILSIQLNNFGMASYDTPFTGDYAGVAEALGGYGERVESPADITPAIKRGIEQTKNGVPALLEFITAEETEKPFV
jgi:acetolactate synthase-1/2/3 large subunit